MENENTYTKITPEEFATKFSKCDIGNANSVLFILNDKIEKGTLTFTGDPVTLDLIYKKYIEYSLWWKSKFGKNDPKYIASKDKKMNVYDFIVGGHYNNSFEREEQPRDLYLFGSTPKEVLITKTKDFIEHARSKKKT